MKYLLSPFLYLLIKHLGGVTIKFRQVKIMKRGLLFFVVLMIGGISVFAQTKTVTNADLEKFRAERLRVEKEYRENYAKWGMPSPEELEKRRQESAAELAATAERLRAERAEQERFEAQQRQQAEFYNYLRLVNTPVQQQYSSPYVYNYAPYGFYRSRTFNRQRNFQQYGPGNLVLQTIRPPRYDFLPGSVLPSGRRH